MPAGRRRYKTRRPLQGAGRPTQTLESKRDIGAYILLFGAFGGQEEFVLAHSDSAVKIVVDGGAANGILFVTIRDRPEENRPAQGTFQCRVTILGLHGAGDLGAVLHYGPLLGQEALN